MPKIFMSKDVGNEVREMAIFIFLCFNVFTLKGFA